LTSDAHCGLLSVSGEYHKNVRAEFASLVTTPDTAEHMDGLAFTRSIGDFHLQAYGITWQPDIVEIDLTNQISKPNMLIVASDGVWDNWKYEDVSNHFMDPSKVHILGISRPVVCFQRI
jgi:serine/threonine protein phosphatase PrpC